MVEAATPSTANANIETRASVDDEPQSSDFWLGEIEAAKKRDKKWWDRGQKVLDRYRDERDKEKSYEKRVNILWSNTEILKAALYSGTGQPDVRRRFPNKGARERVARQAAIVLERAISYTHDAYDVDSEMECAVEDHLLPGRGTTWLEYTAETELPEDEKAEGDTDSMDAEYGQAQEGEARQASYGVIDQQVKLVHVYWQDFLTSFGRKWQDVWWVARRHLYSRDELNKYFPNHSDKIPLGAEIYGAQKPKDQKDDTFKRAAVWEIWDKSKKERIYVAEGYDQVLKKDPDPYQLRPFFPCQEPLYSIKTTGSLTPIPEYTLYQDQAQELDRLTTRLDVMIDALKRRGVYDASMEGADNKLSQIASAGDNEFLPYKGFAALQERGGLAGVFQVEDLGPTITVVEKLYEKSQICIQRIYEITGISDIMRGDSTKQQTATEARVKSQFGSLRIQKRQARVQRFVRDGFRLVGELIAEHFTREKLQEMTGIRLPLKQEIAMAQQLLQQAQQQQQMQAQYQQVAQQAQQAGQPAPPPPQMQPIDPLQLTEAQEIAQAVSWEDIASVLRSDERRCYTIDVESNATAQLDDLDEKQARIEFVTNMQNLLQNSLPAAIQIPPTLPLVKELVMFGVKTFKVGRQLEETFEDAFQQLSMLAQKQQQQPQQPDPKMLEVQAKAKAAEADIQLKKQKADHEVQLAEHKMAADEQRQNRELEHKASMEQMKQQYARETEDNRMRAQAAMESMKADNVTRLEDRRQQFQAGIKDRELQAANDQMDKTAALKQQEQQRSEQAEGGQIDKMGEAMTVIAQAIDTLSQRMEEIAKAVMPQQAGAR